MYYGQIYSASFEKQYQSVTISCWRDTSVAPMDLGGKQPYEIETNLDAQSVRLKFYNDL